MSNKKSVEEKISLGKRIRALREHHGKTLEDFARPLSISFKTVNNYENGNVSASEGVIRELECHYLLNRTWYETGEGKMQLTAKHSQAQNKPKQTAVQAEYISAAKETTYGAAQVIKDMTPVEQKMMELLRTDTQLSKILQLWEFIEEDDRYTLVGDAVRFSKQRQFSLDRKGKPA